MHGLWMIFDPRRVLVATSAMITVSAITLHFLALSSTKFDFLEFKGEAMAAAEMAPLPPGR